MGEASAAAARPLVLAVVLLLALQWPLREFVGWGSTDANDLAQWLFALYVAVAVPHAGLRGMHLVAAPAGHERRWLDGIGALLLAAWSILLLAVGWQPAWRSLAQLERFADTGHPGYFVIRLALCLMGLLLCLRALSTVLRLLRRRT